MMAMLVVIRAIPLFDLCQHLMHNIIIFEGFGDFWDFWAFLGGQIGVLLMGYYTIGKLNKLIAYIPYYLVTPLPLPITMQDLRIQTYQFTITPISITTKANPTHPSTAPKKTIVIKLGQSVVKAQQMNTPMLLTTEVLFSEANQKYCPIKGIIKVYDVMEGDNEIISCIGSFQADEVLGQHMSKQTITKNIGSTTLTMQIVASLLTKSLIVGSPPPSVLAVGRDSQSSGGQDSESISIVSSQNMANGLDESERIDDSVKEEFNKLGGLRRVNTFSLGAAYKSTDITDLKGGINLGFSKLLASRQKPQTPVNKLQSKAKALITKTSSIQEQSNTSSNDSKYNRKQSQDPLNVNEKPLSLKMGAKIHKNYSLDQVINEDKQFGSDMLDVKLEGESKLNPNNSELNLQLESNISNEDLGDNNLLKAPPIMAFPRFSQSSDHSQPKKIPPLNGPIQQIRSLSIVDDKNKQQNGKPITNSINFVNSMQLNGGNFMKGYENGNIQFPNGGTGEELSNSNASVATSLMSYPELFKEYQRNQIETLGEMLVEERRKNLLYEQKIEKLQLKLITSKQKYMDLWQHWQNWCQCSSQFLDNLHRDSSGNYIIEQLAQNSMIALKYNISPQSEAIFTNFLTTTFENCSNFSQELHKPHSSEFLHPRSRVTSQASQINSPQFEKVLQKIEITYANNAKLHKHTQQLQLKLQQLEQQHRKSQTKSILLQKQKQKLSDLHLQQQKQNLYLQSQIHSLTDINTYLKQKDAQMESIICQKDQSLHTLRKKMQENNTEMDKLEEQIANCKKIMDNKELMLEEMREELEDKEEIIEAYREKYGDVKILYKSKNKIDSYIALCVGTIIDAHIKKQQQQ